MDTRPGLYVTHRLHFTHAWLPRDRFDEVIEQDGGPAAAVDGEFGDLAQRIVGAEISCGRLQVRYHSPSQGRLEFGWHGPLRQDGKDVPLSGYPCYDNPYVRAGFPTVGVTIRHAGHWLELDWQAARRGASSLA